MRLVNITGNPNDEFSFVKFSTPDDEVEDQERLEELHQEVLNTWELIDKIPGDKFPQFIWGPLVNEFDDGYPYVEVGLNQEAPIIQAVSSMRRVYNDYFEYIDALELWMEYLEYIEDNFGSFDSFLETSEEGLTTIPVRPRPKLKKKKANKGLIKCKVALSRVNDNEAAPKQIIQSILNQLEPAQELYDDPIEYEEKYWKLNRDHERKAQAQNRIRNARIRSSQYDSGTDAMLQFLQGETITNTKGIRRNVSLNDEIAALHENDFTDPAIAEYELDRLLNRNIRVNSTYGVYFNRDQEEQIEIFTALAQAGFDVGGIVEGSGMRKEARKMLKRQIASVTGEYSDKELKKLTKKRKKAEKKLASRMESDQRIRSILTNNRVTFSRDDDALSFTVDDILLGD